MPITPALSVPFRPLSNADLSDYYALRWRELRQPWGQPPDPTDAEEEARSDHLAMRDPQSGALIACGRLLILRPGLAQIRSMAVAREFQGRGLGRQMLLGLEALARGRGVERVRLHARESALGFYTAAGYADVGPGQLLFEAIPHRWLERHLDCQDFSGFGLQRRPATVTDGQTVAELVFRVLGAYGLAPERDGIDRDLEDLEGFYEGGFFDLLIDESGRLCGTVAVRRLAPERGELRRMYLDPANKGNGLGRACLGHALSWSRAQGIRELELETASVLHEARALYRWAGFQPMSGPNEARRCDLRMVLTDF